MLVSVLDLAPVRTQTLQREGASIYYELWADEGQLFILIPGGPLDAAIYTPLAQALCSSFMPLAFDPRGNSRSSVSDPSTKQDLLTHCNDVAQLIEAEGGGAPALVFGSSMGGLIALELVSRRPDLVKKAIVHEPPCISVMSDPEVLRAETRNVHSTYLEKGVMAAMNAFGRMTGMNGAPPQHMRDPALAMRLFANMDRFFATALHLSEREFDLPSIRTSGLVTVAVGKQSGDIPPARCARGLALELGVESVEVPGGHLGYAEDPLGFADELREIIG